jgi:ribonuclease HI
MTACSPAPRAAGSSTTPDSGVDPHLLERLRLLARARPGAGVLQLPPDLSPESALRAVEAALRALGGRTSGPALSPRGSRQATIHIDGAARGNPGPAGAGILILGPDGEVIDRMHRWLGKTTNNVAEYQALLLALERAQALGIADVEVRSDSELLVRQLNGQYKVKHPKLQELYGQAVERIGRFRRVQIQHVPRALNAEADALANQGIDDAMAKRLRAEHSSPEGGRL